MAVTEADDSSFVVTASEAIAASGGDPAPVIDDVPVRVGAFRAAGDGLLFGEGDLFGGVFNPGSFVGMESAIIDGGETPINIDACHAVTVVIRTVSISIGQPFCIDTVGWAAEQIAARAGAQMRHDRAIFEGIGRLIDAPINPVLDMESEGVARGATGHDFVVYIQIHP